MFTQWQVTSQQLLQANLGVHGFGSTPPQQTTVSCPLRVQHALECLVFDALGKPTRKTDVEVSATAGALVATSSLGGPARFECLDPGSYQLTLPGLDAGAWQLVGVEPLPQERASSGSPSPWRNLRAIDLAEVVYEVRFGEGLDKIAHGFGRLAAKVWEHPRNANLRKARPRRNTLMPGDKVYLPPVKLGRIEAQPGFLYKVQRRDTHARLRLQVAYAFEPMAGAGYALDTDLGERFEGTLDGGVLDVWVLVATTLITLRVEKLPMAIVVPVDKLLPVTELPGGQQRMANLGVPVGHVDHTVDEVTRRAVRRVESVLGREAKGEPNEEFLGLLSQVEQKGI